MAVLLDAKFWGVLYHAWSLICAESQPEGGEAGPCAADYGQLREVVFTASPNRYILDAIYTQTERQAVLQVHFVLPFFQLDWVQASHQLLPRTRGPKPQATGTVFSCCSVGRALCLKDAP